MGPKKLKTIKITVLNQQLSDALQVFDGCKIETVEPIFADISTFRVHIPLKDKRTAYLLRVAGIAADIEYEPHDRFLHSRYIHIRYTPEGFYFYPPHAVVRYLENQDYINAIKYRLNTAIYD